MWPPKYWKFHLTTAEAPAVEAAFTDPRRFGRVRLVDCPGESIRKFSPLVENGPDPVVDVNVFTEEYLRHKMQSRHVPIKALILDQSVISGVGNWVGDEVLYQAKLHPEQYCDDFSDEEIKRLYESIRHVCQFAVDKLGDSDQFPKDWMFHYRWGKGAKGAAAHLPSGERLAFLTVGGRTSCYVPDLQKKSGRIAPGVKEEKEEEELIGSGQEDSKPKKVIKSKAAKPQTKKRRKDEEEEEEEQVKEDDKDQPVKKQRRASSKKPKPTAVVNSKANPSRRRSGRLQGNSD